MSQAAMRTETTTKSQIAKQAEAGSGEFPFPPLQMPNLEIPEAVHDAAAKWIEQGKESFERAIIAAEEMNDALQRACSTAAQGAVDYGAKVSEAMHSNTVAAFELANNLIGAKSLPEAMAMSNAGTRKQFDALAAQNQELWALTQQLVTETIKPIAGGVPKVLNAGVPTRGAPRS